MLTPLPEGGYKAYLVTYNFTEAEKNTILNGGNVPVNGKSSVTPVEGTFTSVMSIEQCTMQINDYYTTCSEGVHSEGQTKGCTATIKSQHVVTMTMVCQGGNSPQPGIEGPGDGGPGEPGGSTSPNPCSVNGVYINPQDPSNSDCNGGVVTQPILEFNPPQTPCQKIKEQRNDEGFKKRMDTLKGKTGLTKETGYIQKWGGSYEYKNNAGATSTANTLTLPEVASNTWVKAYMHTHVDDVPNSERKGIKMFSPADASYLMDLVKNAQTGGHSLSDPYGVMVTSTGNYQIRFTGNQYQIKTFTENELDTHNELFGAGMKEYLDNPKQLEMRFLKYIQKEMLLYGITLYRMNTDGTTTEIKLNADKTDTVENTCPN
ncbi:hypothetical protein [Chryseobacterium luquanense]|uniref:Uncharacterized protein n=1 Tax=Chryseobacterium luquanense TaxID=2983766 RepID=A0ABT3Y909_9FLAO|nr:hypothetical protein [Chryseobacterium luquanense]MCX8534673.1 hypothetical protein [Chryseobacterium luquanense]